MPIINETNGEKKNGKKKELTIEGNSAPAAKKGEEEEEAGNI